MSVENNKSVFDFALQALGMDIPQPAGGPQWTQMDIQQFESMLADAQITDISTNPIVLDNPELSEMAFSQTEPSPLRDMLETFAQMDEDAASGYQKWNDLFAEMQSWVEDNKIDIQNMNEAQLMNNMQQRMEQSMVFNQMMTQMHMEDTLKKERGAWVRSVASSLVDGLKKVIMQS